MKPLVYWTAILFLGIAVLAWGVNPVFVRFAAYDPVGGAAWWRSAIAAAFMTWACRRVLRFAWMKGCRWRLVAAALCYAACNILWVTSFAYTLVARTQVIGCLAAPLALVLARLFRGTNFARYVWTLTWLSVAGVVMVVGFDPTEFRLGDLIALGAGVSWGIYLFLAEPMETPEETVACATLAQWVTMAALVIGMMLINGPSFPYPWPGWRQGTHLAMVGVTGCIAFWFFAQAQKVLPPKILGLALPAETMLASSLAWIVFNEDLGPVAVAGVLLTTASTVALVVLLAPKKTK